MNDYLLNIYRKIDQVTKEIVEVCTSLSTDQINWKINSNQWSIAECIDHIITTNESYFQIFDQVIEGTYQPSIWTKLPSPWHHYLGRKIKAMSSPAVKSRSISPQVFKPKIGSHSVEILEQFTRHQIHLKSKISTLPSTPHEQIIISSPAASYITYNLQDAVQILADHELRHVNQCKAILASDGFPV